MVLILTNKQFLISVKNEPHQRKRVLTFTTLLANSADDKLVVFFLFFTENKVLAFYAHCFHWRQFA